jgi:replicative DNA helicase
MVLAATCRALGYDKEQTYYMCKSALKKQARRTGQDEFPKEELWENIIEESVFSDRWEGGQYSPKTNPWLKKYCEKMGFNEEEREEAPCVDLDTLTNQFSDYATNFEQNIIKTGITELDQNVMFSTSTLNGLLGQPGSGKTTMALNFLLNTSLNGVPSVFLSLDMGAPIVYAKLVQKATGLSFKKALELYRENPTKAKEISEVIKKEYKNVGFNFKSGLTVGDIKNIIQKQSEATGTRPRLLVIDYLECLAGPYSDATANAALIANQLKDLANEEELSILLLLQTQKHSTPDVSDPLLSMKQIKGSSVLEQACSTVLTLWREGYNPNFIDDDKYISFAVVKNRFGSLWRGDFSWEPIRGIIRSLSEEERDEFESFKERKRQDRANQARERSEWE